MGKRREERRKRRHQSLQFRPAGVGTSEASTENPETAEGCFCRGWKEQRFLTLRCSEALRRWRSAQPARSAAGTQLPAETKQAATVAALIHRPGLTSGGTSLFQGFVSLQTTTAAGGSKRQLASGVGNARQTRLIGPDSREQLCAAVAD